MSYLFVFRTGPDIDHMSPLAWKLLEQGEHVEGVMSAGYDPAGDRRIELLCSYPRFRLHAAPPAEGRLNSLRGYLRATLPAVLALLVRRRVKLVAVEWGYGLPAAYDRLRSPAGAVAVARSLGRSLLKARSDPARQMRSSAVVGARLLGIPTVCLPHGLSVKLDMASNGEIVEMLERGPLPWKDRNRFSAFVFNTEHHRQWFLDNAEGDPAVMQTWGSLRWSPEWFAKNRSLAPPVSWPGAEGTLKVVYMVPKWANRVHADAAIDLVRRLQEVEGISLAVMGHPRKKEGNADPLRAAPGVDWNRIQDFSGASSVAVIDACDVVIDVGSSIGIEVLMQGKVLINPTYVHDLETIFDTIEDLAVVAHDADTVTAYLRDHVSGHPHRAPGEAMERLMREAVYGSRPAPFDVLEEYGSRVRELTTQGGR